MNRMTDFVGAASVAILRAIGGKGVAAKAAPTSVSHGVAE